MWLADRRGSRRLHALGDIGNRWLPQTTCADCAQAIFCRRRHQPRRPPLAKIRPGSPAPAIGPGTAVGTKDPWSIKRVATIPFTSLDDDVSGDGRVNDGGTPTTCRSRMKPGPLL